MIIIEGKTSNINLDLAAKMYGNLGTRSLSGARPLIFPWKNNWGTMKSGTNASSCEGREE